MQQIFYASFRWRFTFYLRSIAQSSNQKNNWQLPFVSLLRKWNFSPFGVETVRTVYRAVIISIESNITFVPEVTMYNDRSSCWTRCSQSTTSTTQRAKVAAVAVAAVVVVAASGAEAAEASGIAAAARNQALASHPTTRVRP